MTNEAGLEFDQCDRRAENTTGAQETGAADTALLTKTNENVTCENLSTVDDISLKNWVFAWAADVKGMPLNSDINDLIWVIEKHIKERAALQSSLKNNIPEKQDSLSGADERQAALDALKTCVEGSGTYRVAVADLLGEKNLKTIRTALSSPRVEVIAESIYDAIRLADKEYDGIHEGTIETTRKEYTLKAIIRAIEYMKRGVPEGWKLVPIDPIAPQIMAGIHCLEKNDDLPNIGYGPKAVRIYKNMIEAYRE